ncbi:uncharacterized protein LOC115094360 [Rhinatrema bivittatum]|uniref:uncharacterized protein LOC115094360 n=1 Tax=Rhinatrema bivittatum TaxID=194408 RepID=UPI001128758F|nr:uncharacterized protein LOC115094360 [Rhinatrema bivittatum]
MRCCVFLFFILWKPGQDFRFATKTLTMDSCIAVLFLFSQWSLEMAATQESITAIEGSTVLLPAFHPSGDVGVLQWVYVNESTTQDILDYFRDNDPTINRLFVDRVTFYTSNGSLLLKNVRVEDSGIYKVTVNLLEKEARRIHLKVLAPISKPGIQSSAFLAGSPIELICEALGAMDIVWKKDGKSLRQEDCYHVSENKSILYIKLGEKSNCGSFSCNVTNEISWNESSFVLVVQGISPTLQDAYRVCAAALTLAVLYGLLFILQCCQPGRRLIAGELWRWHNAVLQVLAFLSALLLCVSFVLWMKIKGLSVSFIVFQLFLTCIMGITLLTAIILVGFPARLELFKSRQSFCIILDSAAPVGAIIVILFSIFLIESIHYLQENGCSQFVNLTPILIPLAIIPCVIIMLFVYFHRSRRSSPQAETGSVSERSEQAQEEQLQAMEEAGSGTNGQDSSNGEDDRDEPSHQQELC